MDRHEFQEEKKIYASEDGEVSPTSGSQSLDEVTWSPEEEKRLVRKIDFLVLPLLISAFFALQLDRGKSLLGNPKASRTDVVEGNIGNALTDYFMVSKPKGRRLCEWCETTRRTQ